MSERPADRLVSLLSKLGADVAIEELANGKRTVTLFSDDEDEIMFWFGCDEHEDGGLLYVDVWKA